MTLTKATLAINVDADASYSPTLIKSLGFGGTRFVCWVEKLDLQSEYIDRLADVGVTDNLLVLGSETLTQDPNLWKERLKKVYSKLGTRVSYLVGNETFHRSPSSWYLGPQLASQLVRDTRSCMPDAYLVGFGDAEGQPSILHQLDPGTLDLLDAIGVHPYGKHWRLRNWGTGFLWALLRDYADYGLPLYIDEFGWQTKGEGAMSESDQALYLGGMLEDMAELTELEQQEGEVPVKWVAPFCIDDTMVDGFGIMDRGRPKPSLASVLSITGGVWPPVASPPPTPTPTPEPEPEIYFQLGFNSWHELEPDLIGDPITNESCPWPGNPIMSQATTNGVLVWTPVGHSFFTRDGHQYRWHESWTRSEQLS